MIEYPLVRAGELMDMAIQVENQGMDFYRGCLAGKNTPGPRVKEVFDFLIAQEKLHCELFANIKERLIEDYPLTESYAGEMRTYIDAFVGEKIFFNPHRAQLALSRMNSSSRGPLIAINFAMNFEQKSILFYSAMRTLVHVAERAAVDQVVDAEHRHIRTLLQLRRELRERTMTEGESPQAHVQNDQ